MSQLLISKTTSSIFSRTSTSVTNNVNVTLSPHLLLIKSYSPIHTLTQSHILRHRLNSNKQQYTRYQQNVSKLYARRMLVLASLSASSMVHKTKLEELQKEQQHLRQQQEKEEGFVQTFIHGVLNFTSSNDTTSHSHKRTNDQPPPKPEEWSTIDLVQQRKEFGESINSLGSSRISRLWAAGSRILNLALLASPLSILIPISYLSGPESSTTNFTWNYALWSIEQAGPTFIKLMQWATTRHDLFPPEFISRFSSLQDNTRGHSWNDTVKVLKEAFGPNYNDIIDFNVDNGELNDFQKKRSKYRGHTDKYEPIGSGCIAQVYKGKLKHDVNLVPKGTEVAVKVTHPNILHKVCVDFYILNSITALLELFPNVDYLSLRDSVQQFRDIMLPQLDLRVEMNNLKRFRKNFENDPVVAFPMPLDELTSANVLVESFIHGETILNFCEEGRRTLKEREYLAKLGLETVMKMIFLYDFVHGDLHPGNIIVNKNMEVKGQPWRLNMIDCGLVVEMGEQDHVNLVKVLGAFIKRDGRLAGQLMIDTAKKCQSSELDIQLFCQGIQNICEMDEDQNFLESVGDYLADICYLACKHKVKLEASFINAALACEIMEGIASKLYPTLKVQNIALPLVFKAESMHRLHETFSFLK